MRKLFLTSIAALFCLATVSFGSIWSVPDRNVSVTSNRTVFAPAESNWGGAAVWLDTHWLDWSNYADVVFGSILAITSNDNVDMMVIVSNNIAEASSGSSNYTDQVVSNLHADGVSNVFDTVIVDKIILGDGSTITGRNSFASHIYSATMTSSGWTNRKYNALADWMPIYNLTVASSFDGAGACWNSNKFVVAKEGLYHFDGEAGLYQNAGDTAKAYLTAVKCPSDGSTTSIVSMDRTSIPNNGMCGLRVAGSVYMLPSEYLQFQTYGPAYSSLYGRVTITWVGSTNAF